MSSERCLPNPERFRRHKDRLGQSSVSPVLFTLTWKTGVWTPHRMRSEPLESRDSCSGLQPDRLEADLPCEGHVAGAAGAAGGAS